MARCGTTTSCARRSRPFSSQACSAFRKLSSSSCLARRNAKHQRSRSTTSSNLMLMAALMLLSPVGRAGAAEAERILSFDSVVTVHTDSTMIVQETIRFVSAGVSIQHGLYRDFPTTYTNPGRAPVRVAFQVLDLMRDGSTEPWHAVRQTNGIRVYFGSSSADLEPGEHTYVFTYSSDRQLGFFDDHDELFWNATGNGWEFPIDRASCTVILPGTAWQQITGLLAYTGPQGSTGAAYAAVSYTHLTL